MSRCAHVRRSPAPGIRRAPPSWSACWRTALPSRAGAPDPFLPSGASAFVVPHAAPAYSGTVAAAVVPRHRTPAAGAASSCSAFPHRGGLARGGGAGCGAIGTPLGDGGAGRCEGYPRDCRRPALCDHSLEIQIAVSANGRAARRASRRCTSGRMTAEERAAPPAETGVALASGRRVPGFFRFHPLRPQLRLSCRFRRTQARDCASAGFRLHRRGRAASIPRCFWKPSRARGATVCGSAPDRAAARYHARAGLRPTSTSPRSITRPPGKSPGNGIHNR